MSTSLAEESDEAKETIPVRKESFAALKTLFPDDTSENGKSMSWESFVKSMEDAGFSAIHVGGSAVKFDGARGSIAVHRPHPEPKLSKNLLRDIGKRMQKHFGWTQESFCLRTKTDV